MTVLGDLVRQGAARADGGPALEHGDDTLTYPELLALSAAAASGLAEQGVRRGTPVAVLTARRPETYVLYLACLALEAPVVPLSPAHPVRRLAVQAEAVRPMVLVAGEQEEHLASDVAAAAGCPLAILERGSRFGLRTAMSAGASAGLDAAYVLFTSGSTGVPKGVPIAAKAVEGYIAAAIARYGFGPRDRLSQCFDLTFDPSVFDILCAWGSGASLVVPTAEERRALPRFVAERRLTSLFYVPSAVDQALTLSSLPSDGFPDLRWSLFCGEALPFETAARWAAVAPRSRIENLYGPTELTITCAVYSLPAGLADWPHTANGTIPIGTVAAGHDWVLLDDDHREAATEGELCVRGPQRFGGYLQSQHNVSRFVAVHPAGLVSADDAKDGHYYRTGDVVRVTEDGLLFLGRKDDQIKLGGYRVELGDIAAACRRCPGVREAAAVAIGDPAEERVHLFYSGDGVTRARLRSHLFAELPRYMVPRRLHPVDALPLGVSGKVDRASLRAAAEEGTSTRWPST